MKTELAPTSSDLSLLPRADLPVIWDGFRAKVQELHQTAKTLTVTSVEQKAEMELARTTRLTLKQIRVEVEKKRIELGEGHLTEIQKINKAAKAIKETIEPLEARLLSQETYAERVEADRVLELTKRRNDEVRSVSPTTFIGNDLGKMPQDVYDTHMVRLRAEVAELAEAKRKQAEAEVVAAREREAAEASRRQMQAQLDAQQAETKRQAREVEARFAAERQEAEEKFRREQAEKDRLRDEELKAVEAKRLELEVQLANERAAKLAEAEAARKLALAPDVEKLRNFAGRIQGIKCPPVTSDEAQVVVGEVSRKFDGIVQLLNAFCRE